MRKIKLFLEFVDSDSEVLDGEFVDSDSEVLDGEASKFIPQMTIDELAKMFEQSPEYILEYEAYLAILVGNKAGVIRKNNALEDYKFNLEANFPTYRDGDGGSGL